MSDAAAGACRGEVVESLEMPSSLGMSALNLATSAAASLVMYFFSMSSMYCWPLTITMPRASLIVTRRPRHHSIAPNLMGLAGDPSTSSRPLPQWSCSQLTSSWMRTPP